MGLWVTPLLLASLVMAIPFDSFLVLNAVQYSAEPHSIFFSGASEAHVEWEYNTPHIP